MTRSRTGLAALLGCGALVAAGCHGSRASDAFSAEAERRAQAREGVSNRLPELVPEAAPPALGEAPAELLARVQEDIARRTGVTEPGARLVRDQAMTWSDGSLGCPQPGEVYPQVLVPGYWIVFHAAGRDFDYRVDDRGRFRLCEPRPLAAPGTGKR